MGESGRANRLIGKATDPIRFEIEKGQIRRVAIAIGEDNPIHIDEGAAKAAVAGVDAPIGALPPMGSGSGVIFGKVSDGGVTTWDRLLRSLCFLAITLSIKVCYLQKYVF